MGPLQNPTGSKMAPKIDQAAPKRPSENSLAPDMFCAQIVYRIGAQFGHPLAPFWSPFACFGDDLGLNFHGSEGVELNDGGVRVAWRVFCILLHICALYAPFHSFCISNTVRLLSYGSRPRQEALGWGCHDIAAQGELTSQAQPSTSRVLGYHCPGHKARYSHFAVPLPPATSDVQASQRLP